MILQEIKRYIDTHTTVTRRELAKHFALSEDGVDAMLSVWMKKGVIVRQAEENEHHHVTRVTYRIKQKDELTLNVIV